MLADQTDDEHLRLINPETGEVVFWTADTGIDGHTPVEGAFRRFKDHLYEENPHLLPAWHAFRDNRAKRRAVQWLADNSLIEDEAAERFLSAHPDPDLP